MIHDPTGCPSLAYRCVPLPFHLTIGGMAEEQIVFDAASTLMAGAHGRPGERTFYIAVGQGVRWVRIWLEKGELQNLGNGIAEMLERIGQGDQEPPTPGAQSEPGGNPTMEFRALQLALANDERRNMVVIVAQGRPQDADSNVEVQAWAERPQMHVLSKQIEEVCAAGRPICPLCSRPMDPEGHACVRSNGHMTHIE